MNAECVHSCKGLCQATEVAAHRERESIAEYRHFLSECDYPDVRVILEQLISSREQSLVLLDEARRMLAAKFHTVDQIAGSFR